MEMAPAKHFCAQSEQPMQSAGSKIGTFLPFSVMAWYGQRVQLPQCSQSSATTCGSFLVADSAMKSVIGLGSAEPISSLHRLEAALLHQEAQAGMKLIHDAQAVFHHDGAELDGLGAEGQEVGGGLVIHRAAIAGHGDARAGDLGQRQVADRQHAFAGHADDDAFLPAAVLRPCAGRSEGKLLASVTPAFLFGILARRPPESRLMIG